MYTATTVLTINAFVPMSGIVGQSPTINATIAPPINTSVPPPNQATPVFTGDGQSITVTVPTGYTGAVELTYQLPDPRYVLLGLAFKSSIGGAGRLQFRTIVINRDPTGSQLTVTDACVPALDEIDYHYVILVQEVDTGNIGLIDPDIDNEN